MFMLMGPSSGSAHNSFVFLIECQANYILSCLRAMEKHSKDDDCLGSIALRQETMERYVAFLEDGFKDKVFGSGRSGWYRNKEGVNWTLWPKSFVSYWWRAYSCNEEDYDFSS